jgi:hypothetical protein
MTSVHPARILTGAVAAVAVLFATGPAMAQKDKAGEPVKISTIDGVELHGLFYASPKKDAPTVIMLHKIGEPALNRNAYTGLAAKLQPNYSVLVFDFRGQGKSKDIDPDKFWEHPLNKQQIKGAGPKKRTFELADIKDKALYYPAMVNDIAAVKAWLDRKNDAGACNTSSTILIGAEDGATLGAVWLASQWNLHRGIPNPNGVGNLPNPSPDGKDVIACIWLSISPTLGGGKDVKLTKVLGTPVLENGTPTVFAHGDEDAKGKTLAGVLEKDLKKADNPKKYFYVQKYEVAGKTNLKGINLLGVKGAEKDVLDYLETVVEKKGGEWTKRDFKKMPYFWRNGGQFPPAKNPLIDDANLMFSDYHNYLAR